MDAQLQEVSVTSRGKLLLAFLILILSSVKGEAAECSFAKTIRFIDQQHGCTSDYPELEAASKRGQNWVSSRGLYSIAVPLGSNYCPPAIGIGSTNNSEYHVYSEQRDVNAVEECKQQLAKNAEDSPCICKVIVKDGTAAIDRKTFESMLTAWRMRFMVDTARTKVEDTPKINDRKNVESESNQSAGSRQKPQDRSLGSGQPSKQ